MADRPSYLSQPVNRLLVLGFILTALMPISILGTKVYQAAWEGAWREINEKHRLLAMNLASPIAIYVNDHRAALRLMAKMIKQLPDSPKDDEKSQLLLAQNLTQLKGFRSLALVDTDGRTRALASENGVKVLDAYLFRGEACFLETRKSGRWKMSGIKASLINGEPTLVIGEPVFNEDGILTAVLLAELRTDLIEELRRNIRFGEKGHSAIVDNFGRVIAHPNPDWRKEMRDLSHLHIVQKMMAGKTGVTEFYSPFVKQQMVAGFAAVPGIGWGVMVPQPKPEVERQVHRLLFSHFGWGLFGLVLASVLGVLLGRCLITTPINRLADAANNLVRSNFRGQIPDTPTHAPTEIRQLGAALKKLIGGLQAARSEVEELNESLHARIDEATAQLREANVQLESLAQKDHLTSLANRRLFETTLAQTMDRRSSDIEPLCLMLIDVDNFKKINDRNGHAAGDAVLVQLAILLQNSMRHGDLVARYGGDEFAVQMRCDAEVGRQRGHDILQTIRDFDFSWKDKAIHLTVSIGFLHWQHTEAIGIETMLRKVDGAMYEAKRKGRDTMVEIEL